MSAQTGTYISAKQAAAELGVSLPTIYAYVSRGMLRSTPSEQGRDHRYSIEDVRALVKRRTELGKTQRSGADAGTSGLPVVDTELGLIAGEKLYYRGTEVVKLAGSASLEQAASLLWGCADLSPFERATPPKSPLLTRLRAEKSLGPIARCLAALPIAADADAAARTATSEGRWQTGARILRLMLEMMTARASTEAPIHEQLAEAWRPSSKAAVDILRQCLVLLAEHELNASSFTVRCAVSTNASLYHGVTAGLAALTGPRHGGATFASTKMLQDFAASGKPAEVVAAYIDAGLPFVGFGHFLYPNGDPRARLLMRTLREAFPKNAMVALAHDGAARIDKAVGRKPNIDYALALAEAVLELPKGAAMCLFALGRTAGWIGHAIEQYNSGILIRPRAHYVGPAPREKL